MSWSLHGSLSWPARLSGGAASLERTARVARHGFDPGRQVGEPPRVPGSQAPCFVGLGTKATAQAGWQATSRPAQGACWASLHTSQARQGPRVYTPVRGPRVALQFL